jgi:hypothetical protein
MSPKQFLPFAFLLATSACGARSELYVDGQTGAGGTSTATPTTLGCTTGTLPLERAHPAVMFVIDRSGSMHQKLSTGQDTKWALLSSGLAATLPPVDESMQIGALLFPSGHGTGFSLSCDVVAVANLLPETGHVPALLQLMQDNSPGGATPTAAAVAVASEILLGVHAASSARALVLATDGGPNCNGDLDPATCQCATEGAMCKGQPKMCLDTERTAAAISDALDHGVPTYVIGIHDPGEQKLGAVLNTLADAGGRPKAGGGDHYYAASSAPELNDALTAIRDQVGHCTYLTTSIPDGAGSITVTLDGQPLPYDETGKNGWMWGDEANGELVIVGDACAALSKEDSPKLVAEVHCSGG